MINAIQIKNFKCFSQQKIPLNQLSVFAGSNGGGKSTAIQSLLLVRQTVEKLGQYQIVPFGISAKIKLNEAYHLNIGNSKDVTCAGMDSDIIELSVVLNSKPVIFRYIASRVQPELTVDMNIDDESLKILYSEKEPIPSILTRPFHYLVAERVGPRVSI